LSCRSHNAADQNKADQNRAHQSRAHQSRVASAGSPVVRRGYTPWVTARPAGKATLHHSTDAGGGIRRVGKKRFRYLDEDGRPVTSVETLQRIEALVIPPAWTGVWICADPCGHLQATGRDARGRKQYRYHDDFRAYREATKFDELVSFGERLPRIRAQTAKDLRLRGLPRARVLALVVRLLEETHARVGNEEYARTNGSYGLTTLRDEHARLLKGELHLQFRGKHGLMSDVVVDDRRLATMVKRCQELPGQVLFQYEGDDAPCSVRSTDVNDYLRAASGLPVTAKTFRTWSGTLLASTALAAVDPPSSDSLRRRVVTAAVTRVAKELGNTPAVCRRSYIHPVVVESFMAGDLAKQWNNARPSGRGLLEAERRMLALLRRAGK
jgi:DNA topoisomerase-1